MKIFKNKWEIEWYDIVIIILLTLSPIIVNIIVITDIGLYSGGSSDGWLAFYGGLTGSLVTLYVLFKTLQRNHKENERNRKLQIIVFKHQQGQQNIQLLNNRLIEFQTSIDMIEVLMVVNRIISGNYDDNTSSLKYLVRKFDSAAFSLDFSLPKKSRTNAEAEFAKSYNTLMIEYGMLLADLMYFNDLLKNMPENNIAQYIRQYLYKNPEEMNYNYSSIIDIIKNRKLQNVKNDAKEILSERISEVSSTIAAEKEKVKILIVDLYNEKQKENDLLLNV